MKNIVYAVIAATTLAAAIAGVGVLSNMYGATTTTVTVPETVAETVPVPVALSKTGILNNTEAEELLYMLEEEKLSGNICTYLADKYGTSIFVNMAVSEQNCMDAVMQLIDKYGLNIALGDYGEINNEYTPGTLQPADSYG